MQISFTEKKNIRKSFGKLKESLSIPNLIEVQKNSYKELTDFKIDTNGSVDIFWGDGSSEVVPDNQNFGHTYS